MSENTIQDILGILGDGQNLSRADAAHAFQIIMNGGATPAQMGAFLLGLRVKGESVDELTAGAIAMRVKTSQVKAPPGTLDTCGTGGDAKGTHNVSTAVAIVVAACGVPVAKHGNRSVSSRSGSADVLAHLGVNIDATSEQVERCLNEAHIGFLMAPRFHTAMRHIAPVRQELGMRTVFNLLGPLANPAAPEFQLLGVFDDKWVEPMAYVLRELGAKRAWVVHGRDGMDELTTATSSLVAELTADGNVHMFELTPEDAGLPYANPKDLIGGDISENAQALRDVISGAKGAYRDIVLFNTAAALIIAGRAHGMREAVVMAETAIDSGQARNTLQLLVSLSHGK